MSNGRVLDTFSMDFDKQQAGIPPLHSSFDDWRYIHHCGDEKDPKRTQWHYWYTHKENENTLKVCNHCGKNMILLWAGENVKRYQLDIRVPPEIKAHLAG